MQRRGRRRLLRLLLLLCLAKIKSTAGCLEECSSINVNATMTEINIGPLPNNFTISNVTSADGTLFRNSPLSHSITDLSPGEQYIIYFHNEAEVCCKSVTTRPSPVFDIKAESVTTDQVTLTWQNNDTAASSYSYVISIDGNGISHRNQTSNNKSALIVGLQPGSLYIVTIYPLAADNQTDGNPTVTNIYTRPSPVYDIKAESVTTDQVTLTWQNNDTAASNYSYVILIDGNGVPHKNQTSNNKSALIVGLQPGSLYIVTIYPLAADNQTKGNSTVSNIYTRPSPVYDIKAESVTTDQVTLTWQNNDTAASNYSYVILIDGNGVPHKNQTSNNKSALIVGLQPGSLYIVTIYPLAADNQTKGNSTVSNIYTRPSPVYDIKAESVTTDQVTLTWQNNDTAASNYSYVILIDGNGVPHKNQTSNNKSALIVGLQPGSLYIVTIYPLAADNQTKGNSTVSNIYTRPSPVYDIKAESVTTDQVTLTWQNNDTAASNYSYVILIDGNGVPHKNQTSNNKSALIVGLQPGSLYIVTIYPLAADNQTKGNSTVSNIYTRPSPVYDIKAESVTTDQVTLTWQNNDTAASNYSYVILIDGNGVPHKNQTSNNKSALIVGLQPGSLYIVTIYPLAADNQTKGNSTVSNIYTRPSPVYDIKAESVTTDQVTLTWQNNDTAASNYSYVILIDGNGVPHKNQTSNNKSALIVGLQPGSLYIVTIYPLAADNQTKGNSTVSNIYTRPSPVYDIKAESVTTDQVTLTWQNNDTAASNYSYVILIDGNGVPHRNQTSKNESALIVGLQPGSLYIFTIYPLAADNQTKGNSTVTNICTRLSPGSSYSFMVFPQSGDKITNGTGTSITICTDAAPVSLFNCTAVAKMSELILKWEFSNGSCISLSINMVSDGWNNETVHSPCNSSTVTLNLNYSTSYNVSITTNSCGGKSRPVQKTCTTSITDPPAPVIKPNISAITHNSFNIIFSGFESKNGPLKAYAVVITTAKEGNEPPNSSLKYSYRDFKEGKTNTYITYVLVADQTRASSFPSADSLSELKVGEETTYGYYYNAPLDPLGSYRACVAGFTKIEFNKSNDGPIIEQESYVSFTPYSHQISLPQNPAVITGAVVGCILVAVALSFVVGFVFWSQRRKYGKHNDLSFSQIRPKKSKLIKIENFESYFKKQQADSNCGFAEEYEELRSVGVTQPKFAAELAENRVKNRYNNVLPYDISRVKLSIQNHSTDDYINANYMPGYNSKKEFIAAQGPLPSTLQDFWRMIWEKNIYAIVMLTKCVEQGRTKCEEYWPDKGSRNYGNITVTLISEFVLPEWTIRDFTVEDRNATESHPVRQFHFTSWPDHGVPETTDLLINFRHLVQENMRQNPPDSPTLVHCSAGVGRTGTFIAIDRLIQQMEMENTCDVYGVVYDLRMHRTLMVQTEEQYIFLNQCVLDIIKSQKDKKPDLIYQNTTAMAIYENFIPTPSFEKANGYHA